MPRIMKNLNRISRLQSLYRQREGQTVGIGELTPAQHTLTLAICALPGRSQEEIAREMCINKSTVTRAIGSLVESGYVTRVANELDKRELLIYPTEKMLKALPAVKNITHRWSELITDGISEEELQIFDTLLMKIEENARLALDAEGEL